MAGTIPCGGFSANWSRAISRMTQVLRSMSAVFGLLIDFIHIDHLYRIRNSRGKRLEEVGGFRDRSRSQNRERADREFL